MPKQEVEKKRHRSGGFGRYAYGYFMRPLRLGIMMTVVRIISLLVLFCIVIFLLSGGINQVKTGESMAEYAVGVGRRIGDMINSVMIEKDGPIKITSDGIYFSDAEVPDGSAVEGPSTAEDGAGAVQEWIDSIQEVIAEANGGDQKE